MLSELCKDDTDVHLGMDTEGTFWTFLHLCLSVTQVIQANKHALLFLFVSGRVFHLTAHSLVFPPIYMLNSFYLFLKSKKA